MGGSNVVDLFQSKESVFRRFSRLGHGASITFYTRATGVSLPVLAPMPDGIPVEYSKYYTESGLRLGVYGTEASARGIRMGNDFLGHRYVPWNAIFIIESGDGETRVWKESVPAELVEEGKTGSDQAVYYLKRCGML